VSISANAAAVVAPLSSVASYAALPQIGHRLPQCRVASARTFAHAASPSCHGRKGRCCSYRRSEPPRLAWQARSARDRQRDQSASAERHNAASQCLNERLRWLQYEDRRPSCQPRLKALCRDCGNRRASLSRHLRQGIGRGRRRTAHHGKHRQVAGASRQVRRRLTLSGSLGPSRRRTSARW
jgi:hypothetical protein